MKVTLHDVAEAANVSVSTVSRALNNSKHPVSEKTRERILHVAEAMGYRPNMVARGLRTDRTYTTGLIVDNITSPFTPVIIRGIQDHLKEHGYSSIIINADGDPEAETEAIYNLLGRSIDGIILVEPWLREGNPTLDVVNKPFVFVHRLFNASGDNSVLVDDRYGAILAVEHLLGLGHRWIAYINGPPHWEASAQRLAGYREILATWQVPFDPALIVEGDWEVQGGYRAAQRFLALAAPPTAIFAANDLMALGAIYSIQEAGLSVPNDIAVVGYDDRQIASLSRPTITTITLPCYEMGTAAAKLLLELLDDGNVAEGPVRIQGRLIVRESSGALEGKMSAGQFHTRTTPRRLIEDTRET